MQVVILAGGQGSRLGELTRKRHKAMVEIGGKPVLHHLMDCFAAQGQTRFLLGLGHHKDSILDWLADTPCPDYQIDTLDTGNRGTAGRLQALQEKLDDRFWLSWCDGLWNVDLDAMQQFHTGHNMPVSVAAVHPPSRFGRLQLDGERVMQFEEKLPDTRSWINAGLFIVQKSILPKLQIEDQSTLEDGPLQKLAEQGLLAAYRHTGFWACMDTTADHHKLNLLYEQGKAAWQKTS